MNTGECDCRHIRETTLLHEISDALGWEWLGEDRFDTWAFLEGVDRALVSDSKVEVITVSDTCADEASMGSAS